MNIDLSKFAECKSCARWTKPLETSACNMIEHKSPVETLQFKENDSGDFYCDDFQPVFS